MKKQFGLGSISLILFILAILWSVNIRGLNNFCLGDVVLNSINISTWSDGNLGIHYTIFYTFIFLVPAIIIGCKFPNHRYAKSGMFASIIMTCLLIIFFFLFTI